MALIGAALFSWAQESEEPPRAEVKTDTDSAEPAPDAAASDEATSPTAVVASEDQPTTGSIEGNSKPHGFTDVTGGKVLIIPLEGEVEHGLYFVLNRGLKQARREGVHAIVLHMHTPGGRVDSAMKIRDRLIQVDVPTYTYVDNMAISAGAFIAMATDTIVMGEGSNIGGAQAITLGAAGAQAVGAKFQSIFTSEMRKTAKLKGHPVDIAEAFCNVDTEIPGIKKKGEILTLDYDDAVKVGLAAYVSPSLDAMLEREGLGKAVVERFALTPTDRIARFLSRSAVMGILMMLGIGGIFLEIKTPGFGLPGAVGITAIALYFFGSNLANLSGFMEIIFFAIGLILLLVEIFVIPGFGVFGVVGIACMAGSLLFSLFNLAPKGFDLHLSIRLEKPLMTMIVSVLATGPLIWFVGRLLPKTPFYKTVVLAPPSPSTLASEPRETAHEHLTLGQRGTALTDLRGGGRAKFGRLRVDVMTEGEWISKGDEVQITRIDGNLIVVRSAGDAKPETR